MKKAISLLLVIALTAAIAVGGTLAYLTDRDAKTNVFTVGNVDISLDEDFGSGARLVPGVDIVKKPTITNDGITDAWVWATIAIPSALDNDDASKNVVHFNFTEESVAEGKWTWQDANGWMVDLEETINGVKYNVYTVLYQTALKPGETTVPVMTKVYMDAHVDIAPDGTWHHVENGVDTDLEWSNADGSPIIYVNAYAIQKDGFDTVQKAYAAYVEQWGGKLNGEHVAPAFKTVANSEDLAAAIENAKVGEPVVITLEPGEYITNLKVAGGKDITIAGTGSNTVLNGQIATTSSTAGTLTLRNVTVNVSNAIVDSTGISQTGKSAIAIWGNQTVICENVTFNMDLEDSTAITSWWDTNEGTSIVCRNCTFNCNGQRPIRATGNVTVENCTFNDPYRYAVQLTAKNSTATLMDKAIINFSNNTIVNGESGKAYVYGVQLEGADYGCHDCVITGSGNTIVNGGTESTMYYCECGKVDHDTITWNVEVEPVHVEPVHEG